MQRWLSTSQETTTPSSVKRLGLIVLLIGSIASSSAVEERILSLSPDITDNIVSLNKCNHLVGKTTFCSHSELIQELPSIGNVIYPDIEHIIDLTPTTFYASPLTSPTPKYLCAKMGISVYTSETSNINDVEKHLTNLGKLTQSQAKAHVLSIELQQIKPSTSGKKTQCIVLLDKELLYAAGSGNWLNKVLALANLDNIASHLESPWPQLNWEWLLEHNPEMILLIDPSISKNALRKASDSDIKRFQADRKWSSLTAIKKKEIYYIHVDLLTVASAKNILSLHRLLTQKSDMKAQE